MAVTGALQGGCLNGATGGASSSLFLGPHEKEKSVDNAASAIMGNSTAAASSSTVTTNPSTFHMVTEEVMHKAFDSIEDPEQKVLTIFNNNS